MVGLLPLVLQVINFSNDASFLERFILPAEAPCAYYFPVPVEDIVGSTWMIFGHSAVLPKKSGQLVVGLELGTLSWSTLMLTTRPLSPQYLHLYSRLPYP